MSRSNSPLSAISRDILQKCIDSLLPRSSGNQTSPASGHSQNPRLLRLTRVPSVIAGAVLLARAVWREKLPPPDDYVDVCHSDASRDDYDESAVLKCHLDQIIRYGVEDLVTYLYTEEGADLFSDTLDVSTLGIDRDHAGDVDWLSFHFVEIRDKLKSVWQITITALRQQVSDEIKLVLSGNGQNNPSDAMFMDAMAPLLSDGLLSPSNAEFFPSRDPSERWAAILRGRVASHYDERLTSAVVVNVIDSLALTRTSVGDGTLVLSQGRVVPGDGDGCGTEAGTEARVVGTSVVRGVEEMGRCVVKCLEEMRAVEEALRKACGGDGAPRRGCGVGEAFGNASRNAMELLQVAIGACCQAGAPSSVLHGVLIPSFKRCMNHVQVNHLGGVSGSKSASDFKDEHRPEFLRAGREAIVRGWTTLCFVHHLAWLWEKSMKRESDWEGNGSASRSGPVEEVDGEEKSVDDGSFVDVSGLEIGGMTLESEGLGNGSDMEDKVVFKGEDSRLVLDRERGRSAGEDAIQMESLCDTEIPRAGERMGAVHVMLVDESLACADQMKIFCEECREHLVQFCEGNFVGGGKGLFGKFIADTELRKLNPSWRLKKQYDAFFEEISWVDAASIYADFVTGPGKTVESLEVFVNSMSYDRIFDVIMQKIDDKQRATGRLQYI